MRHRFAAHALHEMTRRGISQELAEGILKSPDQVVPERHGRQARQSRIQFPDGRCFLVRLIVDVSVDPHVVVTAYRTSKIGKYWRDQ